MFQQKIQVTYRDGHAETIVTSQADVSAWEMWGVKRGLRPTAPDRQLMQDLPTTFMRFAAWSAIRRGGGPLADFDAWSDTVEEALPVQDDALDPTPATTPATS